jgi:cysteinyl-tRNA synthetase
MAVLFELAKELRKAGNIITHTGKSESDPQVLRGEWQTLVVLAQVLGLEATSETELPASGFSDADIEAMIQQRSDAKKAKNWAEGDRIRDELKAQGVVLIDKPGGITEWHRA